MPESREAGSSGEFNHDPASSRDSAVTSRHDPPSPPKGAMEDKLAMEDRENTKDPASPGVRGIYF